MSHRNLAACPEPLQVPSQPNHRGQAFSTLTHVLKSGLLRRSPCRSGRRVGVGVFCVRWRDADSHRTVLRFHAVIKLQSQMFPAPHPISVTSREKKKVKDAVHAHGPPLPRLAASWRKSLISHRMQCALHCHRLGKGWTVGSVGLTLLLISLSTEQRWNVL
jgi:hypothetical protein